MEGVKTNEKKIYVSNIPKHVDSKMLQRYFENFGSVYSAVVIGAKKGKSLSYGFVSFSSRKSLEKVLATKQHVLEGCVLAIDTVSVEKAKSNLVKYAGGEDANVFLFVQDIPKDVNRQLLVEHFMRFGELTKARLVCRPDKNKDFVYLQYKSIDAAANAKSQKHKINGLSKESITLVCKVGIFRNQKQIQVMEDAEDLLPTNGARDRKETLFTAPTGLTDEEYHRYTEMSGLAGFTDIMELDENEEAGYFIEHGDDNIGVQDTTFVDGGASRTVPQLPVQEGSVHPHPSQECPAEEEVCLLSYYKRIQIPSLDERLENYRFNHAKPTMAIHLPEANGDREEQQTEEAGRQRANKHLTAGDLTNIGAIGTGRKSGISKTQEGELTGSPPIKASPATAISAKGFKGVLKSFLPAFKLGLWK